MKFMDILNEPLDIQKAYLRRYNSQIKTLYLEMGDFEAQLLDTIKEYTVALQDSNNPTLIKLFGQEILDDAISRANARIESLQDFIYEHLDYINHVEFLIDAIKKNLNKK